MSKVETFSFFPESQIKSISRSLLSALTMQPYSFKSRFLSFRTTKSPGLNFSLTNLSLKLLIWFIKILVWIRSYNIGGTDQIMTLGWLYDIVYICLDREFNVTLEERNSPIIPLLTFSLIWVKLKRPVVFLYVELFSTRVIIPRHEFGIELGDSTRFWTNELPVLRPFHRSGFKMTIRTVICTS